MDYHWNWSVFWQPSPEGDGIYLNLLESGLALTIATGCLAWLVALAVGSTIGVARTLRSPLLRRLGDAYIEVFRNIPLLVQLFIWFFVMPELLPAALGNWIKQLRYGPFYTSTIGIGLYMSARVATQVTAGLKSLPPGLAMASAALGLTTVQSYRHVLLPLAYRIILPPLTSEFLNTIKNTSVALTIGLLELTAQARAVQELSFQVFEPFAAATALYLALSAAITASMRLFERRLAVPGFNAGR